MGKAQHGRLQKLILLGIFSPLLILRWFLQHLPGRRRPSPIKEFRPLPLWFLRLMTWPLFLLNPPTTSGIDKLAAELSKEGEGREGEVGGQSRVLLVGNQQLFGLDQLVIVTLLYWRCGLFCRRMHDSVFGKLPCVREVLELMGGVMGTRRNCEELMQLGQPLIFYPGGMAESFKAPGVAPYSLLWGERLGFIHMAIKHGYTLIPFASVGLEDALWVLMRVPLQPLLLILGETRPPASLPLLLPYNSLERQYIALGDPIRTSQYNGEFENIDNCVEVYRALHGAVEGLVEECRLRQETDPGRYPWGRLWIAACTIVSWLLGWEEEEGEMRDGQPQAEKVGVDGQVVKEGQAGLGSAGSQPLVASGEPNGLQPEASTVDPVDVVDARE